jgi:hypothetical protein
MLNQEIWQLTENYLQSYRVLFQHLHVLRSLKFSALINFKGTVISSLQFWTLATLKLIFLPFTSFLLLLRLRKKHFMVDLIKLDFMFYFLLIWDITFLHQSKFLITKSTFNVSYPLFRSNNSQVTFPTCILRASSWNLGQQDTNYPEPFLGFLLALQVNAGLKSHYVTIASLRILPNSSLIGRPTIPSFRPSPRRYSSGWALASWTIYLHSSLFRGWLSGFWT